MVKITGDDLAELLDTLDEYPRGAVRSVRIDVRRDGVAVKVNEGMWSATLGEREAKA